MDYSKVYWNSRLEKEHERILSSYGGPYDDPKLEALIGKTVDRHGKPLTMKMQGPVEAWFRDTSEET